MASKTQNSKTAAVKTTEKKAKVAKWTPFTDAEATEADRVARPAIAACLCGCGTMTKSRFAPGHDATHKERIKATILHGTPKAKVAAASAQAKFGW